MRTLRLSTWLLMAVSALACGVACGQSYYQPPAFVTVPAGLVNTDAGMLVGDFNNDQLPDVVAPGALPSSVWPFLQAHLACLLQTPAGSFAPPLITPVGVFGNNDLPRPIAVVDLDQDQNLDVVTLSWNGVRNLMGDGTGGFVPGAPLLGTAPMSPRMVTTADLDNDGSPELIALTAAFFSPSTVVVWTNVSGTWVPLPPIAVGGPATGASLASLRAGDFDGDGWVDVALSTPPSTGVFFVLRNTHVSPGFGFVVKGPFALGPVERFTAADVNGDGCSDLLAVSTEPQTPSCILGSSPSLNILPPVASPFAFPGWAEDPLVADADGDGMMDWFWARNLLGYTPAGAGFLNFDVFLLLSRGGGTFASPIAHAFTPPGGHAWGGIALGDMDGDSDPDMIVAREIWPQTSPSTQIGIAWNEALQGLPVAGSQGPPLITVGTAAPGNSGFSLGLSGAGPGLPATLGISLGTSFLGALPYGIWLDLAPGQLILPAGGLGSMLTDASGAASFPIPIPSGPLFAGAVTYAQWIIADPAGGFVLGLSSYAITAGRKIIIW